MVSPAGFKPDALVTIVVLVVTVAGKIAAAAATAAAMVKQMMTTVANVASHTQPGGSKPLSSF